MPLSTNTASSVIRDLVSVLASALLAFASVAVCGMRGMETFDMSILADGGWRIYSGQIPYRDFLMPIGPLALYFQAAAFRLAGGFSWAALVFNAAAVNALAAAVVYALVRLRSGPRIAFPASLITGAVFYLPIAFPWYDQTAWFVFLCALLTSDISIRAGRGPAALTAAFVSGCLAGLSLFAKINLGAFFCLALTAILVCGPGKRRLPLFFIGIFSVCALGTAVLQSQGDLFGSMIQTASGSHVGQRLNQAAVRLLWALVPARFGPRMVLNLANLLMLASSVWLLLRLVRRSGRQAVDPGLAVRFLAAGILQALALCTGGGHLSLYLPLLGLQAGYLAAMLPRPVPGQRPFFSRLTPAPVMFAAAFLLYGTACRQTWEFFPAMDLSGGARKFADGPFRGCTVRTETYRETDEILEWNRTVPKDSRIFVFPESQLLYGALGRTSPRGVRLWYHAGLTYDGADPDTDAVKRWTPDYVVLRRYGLPHQRPGDPGQEHLSRMPGLDSFLKSDYSADKVLSGYRILRRNSGRTR